jgi:hypothetical protein
MAGTSIEARLGHVISVELWDIFLGIVLEFRLDKVLFVLLWPQCAHHGCLILDAVMTCILGVMMLE